MALSYKKAGVDIKGIRKSQAAIGRLIRSTHGLQGAARVKSGFGHYAGIVGIPGGAMLAAHTDGVGTKVLIAGAMKRYDTVGIDCVAMNVNDIICTGAVPVAFVDYIAANKNNPRIIAEIVRGLVTGAKRSAVPIVGGETAIMPDLIAGSGFAFDLAGMVTGYLAPRTGRRQGGRKRGSILGESITPGNVIVGADSTGLHSNGYSLARSALLGKYSVRDRVRGVGRIGDALLEPTRIYTKPVLEIVDSCEVAGLAHITGGSFAKLLRLKNTGYEIDSLPKTPPIMGLVAEQGVAEREMYGTFNMGVGFCVIAPGDQVSKIRSVFGRYKIGSRVIGRVTGGRGGVTVNSVRLA